MQIWKDPEMQRILDEKNNIAGERFSTFEEMYRVCESRNLNEHYSSDYDVMDKRKVHGDKGVHYTWEETKNDIMYGSELFDEDFARIKGEVDRQVQDYMADFERTRTRKDVVGQSVAVERALMGYPKAMNRRKPVRLKQKTVHFYFNITCAWHTSTDDRLKSGCILMAVAEAMEKMGYQTAITYTPYFSYEKSGERNLLAEVQIKDFKTRFNARKMQFPLAAESVLFQLGCWWMHRTPEGQSNWGYGEGRSVDYDSRRKQQAKDYARGKGAIYLSNPVILNELDGDVNKVFEYVFAELGKM